MSIPTEVTRRSFLKQTLKTTTAGLLAGSTIACASGKRCKKARCETWRIGCYTRPWDQHDYRVALDAIAKAGFKYAGLMTTKSESRLVISPKTSVEESARIGEETRQRGLHILSVYGGGIPIQESLQAAIDGLRSLIDNCAAAKGETVLFAGISKPEAYAPYYKAIAECCDYAAERNVGITLKPHGGLNMTGPQCRKAIETVGHKNFTLWYDAGNVYYYTDGTVNPVDDAKTVDGLVTGVCIKDYLHPKNVMVTPGTGMVDFPAVFDGLRRGGFIGGSLVIETVKQGTLAEIAREAKIAREFVERLVA